MPIQPSRRDFLKTSAAAGLAVSATAKSYARILGASDRVNFAIAGLNGRGGAHLSAINANKNSANITHICDVESTILDKFAAKCQKLGYTPALDKDFRKMLEAKDIDAISIATPDHLHTTIAIAGLKAGKNVYVEKPPSYDPHEGELLVAAANKYSSLKVQVGSQQRSSPHSIEIIGKIHSGLIGHPFWAQAWYVNNRKPIGHGKPVPVPATLDWDLFQGPAPRREYTDNIQPYNWHWFRGLGTGEALNNGTHEVDVARWIMQVDFPHTVSATGGRYFYQDDWQFPDTMMTTYEYPGKLISWESRSCNALKLYDRERGVAVMGDNGSVILDRDGYDVFDASGKKINSFSVRATRTSSSDTVGADSMTNAHFLNFIDAIRKGEALRAPAETGRISVTLVQLSNIAYFTQRNLKLNATGHIVNDPEALAMTHRTYAPGWEIKI